MPALDRPQPSKVGLQGCRIRRAGLFFDKLEPCVGRLQLVAGHGDRRAARVVCFDQADDVGRHRDRLQRRGLLRNQ